MGKPSVAQVRSLNAYAFRYVCAELLSKYGFRDVRVGSLRDDNGADIFATDSEGTWVIRCLNRSLQDGMFAVSTAKKLCKADRAMLICTDTFSPGVLQKGAGMGVRMVGDKQLDEMLRYAYQSDYEFNAVINSAVQQLYNAANQQNFTAALSPHWGSTPGCATPALPTSEREEKQLARNQAREEARLVRAGKKEEAAKAAKNGKRSPGITLILIIAVFTFGTLYILRSHEGDLPEVRETETPVEVTATPRPGTTPEPVDNKFYGAVMNEVPGSGTLQAYGYDSTNHAIVVIVTNKSLNAGTWRILDVPFDVWKELTNQRLPGDYFWGKIWPVYEHELLE